MKNLSLRFALVLLAFSGMAHATPIEFNPANSIVQEGDTVAVDIVVTPDVGVFIGSYDIDVLFDESLLSVADVIFGTSLGGPFDSIQGDFGAGPGGHFISEISFLFDLSIVQAGDGSPFTLATILFNANAVGESLLSFGLTLLGDEFGFPVANPPVPGSGSIVITEAVAVPEPGSLILFLCGLVLLITWRRFRA